MIMILKACLLLSLIACIFGHDPSETYPNSVQLSSDLMLYWKVSVDHITFETHVRMPRGGWSGIGFAKNSTTMFPADIAMGFVDKNNTGHIVDLKETGHHGAPRPDQQQDYTLQKAVYEQAQLVVVFSRQLNTHDADDVVIHTGPMELIWAYGSLDTEGNLPAYHDTQRGAKSVTLIQPDTPVG